jgi:hypothetical protein
MPYCQYCNSYFSLDELEWHVSVCASNHSRISKSHFKSYYIRRLQCPKCGSHDITEYGGHLMKCQRCKKMFSLKSNQESSIDSNEDREQE